MAALTPRTAELASLSRSGLYRAARARQLERVARGIYLPADAEPADWDMLEAATRRADGAICLISALAHHDLMEEIPAALDVAIPRGSRIPVTDSAIAWHSFDRATFGLGREVMPIAGTDQVIGIYSPERSITDAFRLRGAIVYEIARDALREWLRRGGEPAQLIAMAARIPRARTPIMNALEMLT